MVETSLYIRSLEVIVGDIFWIICDHFSFAAVFIVVRGVIT